RVVEEDGVVPGDVPVLLGAALDRDATPAQPVGALVDVVPGRRLECDVMDADAVTVEGLLRRYLRLSQAKGAAWARDVPHRLAALGLDLPHPMQAKRFQQFAVEGQAAKNRADDEVDVVKAGGAHLLPDS